MCTSTTYFDDKLKDFKESCGFVKEIHRQIMLLENNIVRKATLELLQRLSCDKKTFIVLDGEQIEWSKYKEMFKENKVDLQTMLGLGGLRKLTIIILVKQQSKFHELQHCYQELGSTDPTSDLDFTLISFNEPMYTIELMIKFYNTFHSLYGAFPDVVFDTNYYVCNTVVPIKCFHPTPTLTPLFTTIDDCLRLYYSDDLTLSNFTMFDAKICYLVLRQKELSIQHKQHTANLKRLIQSAYLYFAIINYVLINGISSSKLNKVVLLLRTLYFIMSFRSNESYIHDGTFLQIVRKKKVTFMDQLLSFMDNYMFILEWFYKSTSFFYFFDASCKYIHRAHVALHETSYEVDPILSELCHEYRTKYRGKFTLEELETKDEVTELFKQVQLKYKSIDAVMVHLHSIYVKIINDHFGDAVDASNYLQSVFTLTKTVKTDLAPHIVISGCVDIKTIIDKL
jgi:hypothetical protein